jgi:hypothetical protein
MEYNEFLKTKYIVNENIGFNVDLEDLNPMLFDYQED